MIFIAALSQHLFYIQDKENEYINLKCLMLEENETVHQIECQMKHLMEIIARDQEMIIKKDQQISSLQKTLDSREEADRKNNEIEFNRYFQDIILEKDIEMKNCLDEKEYELFNNKIKIEDYKRVIENNKVEIENLESMLGQQMELAKTHDVLKYKMGELMNIIDQQNKQIAQFNEKESDEDTFCKRNEVLQKELHVLNVKIHQKDLDIKSLKGLLEDKEETIEEKEEIIDKLNQKVSEATNIETQVNDLKSEMQNKDETINCLQQRITSEQKNSEETEAELIKLKIDFDQIKTENTTSKSLDNNDDLIEKLQNEIKHEREIGAHVQFAQEKEIIEKDREIAFLREALSNLQDQNKTRPKSRNISRQVNCIV